MRNPFRTDPTSDDVTFAGSASTSRSSSLPPASSLGGAAGLLGLCSGSTFACSPSVVCPWYPTSRARRFASVRRTRARAPKRTGTAGGALSCGAGRACLSSTLVSSRQARRARGWAATSGAAVMLGMGDGRVSLHVPWTTRALCRSLPAPAAAVVRHCAGVCPSFPCLEVEPAAVVARGFAGMRRNLDT